MSAFPPRIYRDENYRDPPMIICPICGEEAETYYSSKKTGEVYGCDRCMTAVSAADLPEAWTT